MGGGEVASTDIGHRPLADFSRNYPLAMRVETETPIGTVFRTRYLRLDMRQVIDVERAPVCRIQFEPGATGGRLTEAYYELQPVANPIASGW